MSKIAAGWGEIWHALSGIGLLIAAPVLVVALVLIYPFFVVLMYGSYWLAWRKGLNARCEESHFCTYSSARGEIVKYRWEEIAFLRKGFHPPIRYLIVVLKDGHEVHLESGDQNLLLTELSKRGFEFENNTHGVVA
jgi:hypothetical protein